MVLAFEFIFIFGCAESSLLCELFSSCVSVATLSLWFIIMWFIIIIIMWLLIMAASLVEEHRL